MDRDKRRGQKRSVYFKLLYRWLGHGLVEIVYQWIAVTNRIFQRLNNDKKWRDEQFSTFHVKPTCVSNNNILEQIRVRHWTRSKVKLLSWTDPVEVQETIDDDSFGDAWSDCMRHQLLCVVLRHHLGFIWQNDFNNHDIFLSSYSLALRLESATSLGGDARIHMIHKVDGCQHGHQILLFADSISENSVAVAPLLHLPIELLSSVFNYLDWVDMRTAECGDRYVSSVSGNWDR